MGTLQRELHGSQETIRALTEQNAEMRRMIIRLEQHRVTKE